MYLYTLNTRRVEFVKMEWKEKKKCGFIQYAAYIYMRRLVQEEYSFSFCEWEFFSLKSLVCCGFRIQKNFFDFFKTFRTN